MSVSVSICILGLILVKGVLSQICGVPVANTLSTRIMNGIKVKQGDFPWMAALMLRTHDGESVICSAFMIDSRHALTAAHCFEDFDMSRIQLYSTRIGSIHHANGTRYDIVNVVIHEGYQHPLVYDDIAMLTLDRDVRFRGFYPVCLPFEQSSRHNLQTRQLTVTGWGADRLDGESSPVLMRLSSMPVITNRECNKIYKSPTFRNKISRGITPGILCAGFREGGKDSCQGDSGGPLMIRDNGHWTVVGIVGFGSGCGNQGFVGGYTRMSFYMNWVRSKMKT